MPALEDLELVPLSLRIKSYQYCYSINRFAQVSASAGQINPLQPNFL